MILQGEKLIEEVNNCNPMHGVIALWWLGQHSFILKTNGVVIYIDLFLSDHGKRLIPPLLAPEQVTNADFFIGTHNHRDHIDKEIWPVLSEASPGARFIVPEILKSELSSELNIPLDRFIGMNDYSGIGIFRNGKFCILENRDKENFPFALEIYALASAHEFLDKDEKTQLYPYLGFIIMTDKNAVYHAGDCCVYEGLRSKLKRFPLTCMLLPINGRDAEKYKAGIIGNMTYQEAADLAGSINPKLVVPTHFDMFPGNKIDPALFRDYIYIKYPESEYRMKVKIPKYAEKFELT